MKLGLKIGSIRIMSLDLSNNPETRRSLCNIPPVSVGLLSVDRARGINSRKVSMENIY
jgi:hypothetical protein